MVNRWVEHAPEKRSINDVYHLARFGCMTPYYLLDVVQNNEAYRTVPDMQKRVQKAIGYLALGGDTEQQEWVVENDSAADHKETVNIFHPRQSPQSRLRIFSWDIPAGQIRTLERNQSLDSPRFLSNGYFFDLFIKREESLGLYLEFLPDATQIADRFRLPKATWSVWARSNFVSGSYKCLKATSKNFTSNMRPGLGFGHANVFSKEWEHVTDENFDYCVKMRFSFKIKLEWV